MGDDNEQAQPRSSGGAAKWIIGGCCCFGVVAAGAFFALGGLAVAGIAQAMEVYKVEATAFLAEAEAGSFEAAYARFSPQLQSVQSLEDFREGVKANPDLFAAQSLSFNSINADGVSGVTKVRGTVTSKSGKVRHCLFAYIHVGATLKLIEYQIADAPIPE